MNEHTCCDSASVLIIGYGATWYLDDDYDMHQPITHCPWCGVKLPPLETVEYAPIKPSGPECPHGRLELRGYERPKDLASDTLWLPETHLVCLDCATYLMSSPDDLTTIVNIPHPPREECTHPDGVRVSPLCGFGRWRCLQCGEAGMATPTSRLEIISGR